MPPKQTDSQVLPNKEQALFRQLIKQYESKMYKKGIKTADTILKKHPDNGETLAMKGLLLNCLERKEEAYDLVKRGVKANLRSHVCWHVYGLLYRSDREYDEAIKCYKNALRMDSDNLTVLRDLAQLQVQMRDLTGFLDTRQTLLEQKANNRQHWVALALAHHLCGNHEVAATVLEAYDSTAQNSGDAEISPGDSYEHSEILLYKVSILEEGAKYEAAIAALDDAEAHGAIKDRLSALETRARLLLALNRSEQAEEIYRRLLNINPEHYGYHDGLIAALQQDPERGTQNEELLNRVYTELQTAFPHGIAVRRRPLDFLTGPAFEAAADAFVRRYLSKGIPSLFSELRPLYSRDSSKVEALGRVFHRIEAALETTGRFPDFSDDTKLQHSHMPGPQALVWTRLYLALHADMLGNSAEALRLIDSCIAHTPTLIELHSARSRILKHAGDMEGAAAAAQHARNMDLADRFLNCAAVKALFRAGEVNEAERVVALFTRDGEQANNLYDMQALWYEVSSGRAYLARHDFGRALKRFLKVDSHFADFVEDQFDFHGYCIRKQTMRAYVDMLRFEDSLYRHPTYAKAATGAINAYLSLFDKPPRSAEEEEAEQLGKMTAEEAKRYVQRKRREEAKRVKEAAAAAAAAAEKTPEKGKKGQPTDNKRVDPDPDGVALASTTDPLGEATKLMRRLKAAASDRIETHLLAFEVYWRKGRLLLAARAVHRALNLAAGTRSDPDVHYAIVRLLLLIERDGHNFEPVVADALQRVSMTILNGAADVAAYVSTWETDFGSKSLLHRLACARSAVFLRPETLTDVGSKFVAAGPCGASHAACIEAYSWLVESDGCEEAALDFKSACAAAFRYSRYFGGDSCVPLDELGHADDGDELSSEVKTLKVSD